MADNDAAATRGVLTARTARNAAFTVAAAAAAVAAVGGFLIEDAHQRLIVVGAGLIAAVIWLPLGFTLERAFAAAGSRPQGKTGRPAVALWAYFVMVAFALAGAGAGLNLVGYQTSATVGTAAQLTTAAAACGAFLFAYLLISQWRRGRRT